MDVLGLLAAVIAVAVFPGGLYLGVGSAIAHGAAGGGEGTRRGTGSAAFAAGLMLVAGALLPLPGSPASSLPPDGGAMSNLFAVLLLGSASVAASTGAPWPWRRTVAAAATVAPLLALSAGAATFSFPVVLAIPRLAVPRALAGLAVLLAAPVLLPHEPGHASAWAARAPLVVLSITGALMLAPSAVLGQSGALVAVAGLAAAAVVAAATRIVRGVTVERGVASAALVVAVASVAGSLVSGA